MPPSGSTHASRSKPCVLRRREHRRAELARPSRRGSASPSGTPRSAAATSAFISRATGESDSSSVVWHVGQTSCVSSSPWLACCRAGGCGRRERERRARRRDEPHDVSARRMPSSSSSRRSRAGDVRRHDAAAPVDEEGLRAPRSRPSCRTSCRRRRGRSGSRRRSGRGTPARRRFRSCALTPTKTTPLSRPGTRGVGDVARLLLARDAVRLPRS